MNLALWIVAGLLATAYLLGGAFKVITPKEKIAAAGRSGQWVEDFSAGGMKAIGVLEVLAAMGLILPAVLDIAPARADRADTRRRGGRPAGAGPVGGRARGGAGSVGERLGGGG